MLKDFVPVLQRMSISLSTHDDTIEFESLDLQTKLSEVESWSKIRPIDYNVTELLCL